jgi:hypothetical protein
MYWENFMFKMPMTVCIVAILLAPLARAEESADELAKKLSNPVAALISVPFQFNGDFNYGSENGTRVNLNIQPVIPTSISEDWNLITRVIIPITSQNDLFGNSGHQFGLGDTTPSFFFSPKAPTASGWIWGVGPVFLLPTATNDLLGTGKYGIGPTAVFLKQTASGWTYGALVNQIWSVGGLSSRADVSSMYLQPFVSKALGRGRTLSFNFESTYDWENKQWSVPFNASYSQVMKWGDQIVSLSGGVRWWVETPGQGPDWGVRVVLTLLFPK